jgi:hypothetical protein
MKTIDADRDGPEEFYRALDLAIREEEEERRRTYETTAIPEPDSDKVH